MDSVPRCLRVGFHAGWVVCVGSRHASSGVRFSGAECGCNPEFIWLTDRLKPDLKTIADCRRGNGPAISKAWLQFVALRRNVDLLDGDMVAIDATGSRL